MLFICRVSQRWSDTERRESLTISIIDVEHCTRSLYKKLINKGFGGDKDSYSFSLVNIQYKLKNIPFIFPSDCDEGFTNCAHVFISNNKV